MTMKAVLVYFSGSLAITASVIDSATDSIASLVLFIGLKLSARKTQKFPLGLYKIENLLSVAVAFFIFFAGYEIIRSAFSSAPSQPDISLTVILLMAAATIVILLFGQYAIAAGRKTESPTMIAEGRHRQVDALASVVVLVSLVLGYFQLKINFYGINIDQIAAILVVLFIVDTGWELLSDGMRVLLDASIDYETLAKVRSIIEAEPMVAGVQSLAGRNAGRFRFLQATISVRTDDLQKAHRISENIESTIYKKVPHVERMVIHYEPHFSEYQRIAIPLANLEGELSEHFGHSPYFTIVQVRFRDNHIKSQEIMENPYIDKSTGKGILVAEWLVEKKVDQVVMLGDIKHKGPGYVFSNAGVKIHVLSVKTMEEALSYIVEKETSL
jgi:cation diffusion facilitator family transporter